MSDDKFEKTFASPFTIPGRLATLQCMLRHIFRTYKEFEDGMSELRFLTNAAEASGSSTVSLQSQREQQAPTAPLVPSSHHGIAVSLGPVVVNTACSSSETAAVSAAARVPVPVSGTSSADSVSAALRPHVCALNCVCYSYGTRRQQAWPRHYTRESDRRPMDSITQLQSAVLTLHPLGQCCLRLGKTSPDLVWRI